MIPCIPARRVYAQYDRLSLVLFSYCMIFLYLSSTLSSAAKSTSFSRASYHKEQYDLVNLDMWIHEKLKNWPQFLM